MLEMMLLYLNRFDSVVVDLSNCLYIEVQQSSLSLCLLSIAFVLNKFLHNLSSLFFLYCTALTRTCCRIIFVQLQNKPFDSPLKRWWPKINWTHYNFDDFDTIDLNFSISLSRSLSIPYRICLPYKIIKLWCIDSFRWTDKLRYLKKICVHVCVSARFTCFNWKFTISDPCVCIEIQKLIHAQFREYINNNVTCENMFVAGTIRRDFVLCHRQKLTNH